MRRQSLFLLLIGLFLLLLPISKDSGIRVGVMDYISDISDLSAILLDPAFLTASMETKIGAALYIVQLLGWILFAVTLIALALFGLIRNRSTLKFAALLGVSMLIYGVIEVGLFVGFGSLTLSYAILTRFGLDFSDFMDDYDALLNSTLVPIGLIVWYFLRNRMSQALENPKNESELSTENSSS